MVVLDLNQMKEKWVTVHIAPGLADFQMSLFSNIREFDTEAMEEAAAVARKEGWREASDA